MNTETLRMYLQRTADEFPILDIFTRSRYRELPVRNFIMDLLINDNVQCNKEVRIPRSNGAGNYRSIDLVVENSFFELGHFTLAQYGPNNNPITNKLNSEREVFQSIERNLPQGIESYLIYITTDIVSHIEIDQNHISAYPLLNYFYTANYNEEIKNLKNGFKSLEIERLRLELGENYLFGIQSTEPHQVLPGIQAVLTLDVFKL